MISKVIECAIDRTKQHDNTAAAMKVLTGAGFRLYSYLCSMAELEGGKSVFQLCQEDVSEYTGMGIRTYFDAVKDLTDKGFIVPKAGKRRYFLFDGAGKTEHNKE